MNTDDYGHLYSAAAGDEQAAEATPAVAAGLTSAGAGLEPPGIDAGRLTRRAFRPPPPPSAGPNWDRCYFQEVRGG